MPEDPVRDLDRGLAALGALGDLVETGDLRCVDHTGLGILITLLAERLRRDMEAVERRL